MPTATTSPWEPLPRRRKPRAEHKHDGLCVTVSVLTHCWCRCPKCWDVNSSKCVCAPCPCNRRF